MTKNKVPIVESQGSKLYIGINNTYYYIVIYTAITLSIPKVYLRV